MIFSKRQLKVEMYLQFKKSKDKHMMEKMGFGIFLLSIKNIPQQTFAVLGSTATCQRDSYFHSNFLLILTYLV